VDVSNLCSFNLQFSSDFAAQALMGVHVQTWTTCIFSFSVCADQVLPYCRLPRFVKLAKLNNRVGQSRIPIYTVYDRIFNDFPVKNAVFTPYI